MSTEQQIKDLAYQLWEQEGRPQDRHVEHYYRALNIIRQRELSARDPSRDTAMPTLGKLSMPSSTLSVSPMSSETRTPKKPATRRKKSGGK